MKLTQLDYTLPEKNIAHSPASPRDAAKLMVVDRNTGQLKHSHFYNLPNLLTSNDVLVFNQTKVFPARLFGKKETGGKVEILLLRNTASNRWQAMHKGKLTLGQKIKFPDLEAKVTKIEGSEVEIEFSKVTDFWEWLYAYGQMPLPPYIDSSIKERELRTEYQTVFAKDRGSVAAPTAGIHFTEELLEKLKQIGVQIEYVTLHVGAGTFLPIKAENLKDHQMHEESYSLEDEVAARLNFAKKHGKRIIAVGTTSTRVLETLTKTTNNKLIPGRGKTDIFIYPPYKFKFVDALITNFHLPHSTLLALVASLATEPNTKHKFTSFKKTVIGKAYKEAIENNYRFYSFGDGMLIQ